MPLAFAIAIHNIPEGIAIAVPVYFATQNKFYAFSASLLSGLAEPVGAALGYWLLSGSLSHATFGWVFGLIAGVMVFPALDELLPAAAMPRATRRFTDWWPAWAPGDQPGAVQVVRGSRPTG